MTQKFIIPPRTTDGNEIRKFFVNICQYINRMMEVDNSVSHAYLNTAQEGIATATPTKIGFDVESRDIGGNFASGAYTIPVTGDYHFDWSAYLANDGGTMSYGYSILYLVGTGNLRYGTFGAPIGGEFISHGSSLVYCTAGQVIEVWANAVTASSTWKIKNSSVATFMSVHLIARA